MQIKPVTDWKAIVYPVIIAAALLSSCEQEQVPQALGGVFPAQK
ncbi:MAG: hypothetical protein ACI4PY_07005 [Akkermansia muciniphila]|nr:hypothetical protein [Akkermansia muciniphila]